MGEYTKAYCHFQTSDNEDGTFWIWASPQGQPLILDGQEVTVGLDIKPGTPASEADELAASNSLTVSTFAFLPAA
jgi:hypothetical protein